MTRVFLVDDHAILREGLTALLRAQPDVDVVGEASSAAEALAALDNAVDVLVTDQSMPGMDGMALVAAVRERFPRVAAIMLTMHEERHLYRQARDAGVRGFVLKQHSGKELLAAVRMVASGGTYTPAAFSASPPLEESPLLTRREVEILRLVVRELSNEEIAETLFISRYTVETHRKNIFRKTGASSLVGLINFAHDNGLA